MGHSLNTLGETLTDQIREIVTGGDGKVPASPNSFITFCTPGLATSPESYDFAVGGLGSGADAEADKRILNNAFNWAQLVDFVPDVQAAYANGNGNGVFRPGSQARLSSIYGEILRFSKVVNKPLTAKEKEKLEKFRALLYTKKKVTDLITDEVVEVTENSPVLKAYLDKQQDYITAVMTYNAKRIAAQSATGVEGKAAVADWAANAELYRLQVKTAADAWSSGGYRNQVDAINAFIDQLTRRDMTLWKQRLVEIFDDAHLNGLAPGQRFPFTTLIPGDFAKSNGWTGYTFGHTQSSSNNSSTSSSWSAKAGVSFGLFSFGGNANGSSSQYGGNSQLNSFKLSMELCPVVISRPWCHSEFFANRGWTLRKGEGWMYDDMPSDGAKPPKGNFIGYPTMAIFARNITITSNEFASAYDSYSKEIGGGGSIGWGPFSLGGGYTTKSSGSSSSSSQKEATLTVPGMQVIAFVNHLIGKSPNPLPELKPADFA